MHRFFVKKTNFLEDNVTIDGDDVKHIKNVLRLNIEDIISVCDGEKSDYTVKITEIGKDTIKGEIVHREESKSEPPIEVVLFQGIPKSTKMDLITQKATELGIIKIVPVITERTVIKIQDRKKEEKKLERWQRIAEEASKQSKRGAIPEIGSILTFKEMVSILKDEKFVIVPYENEKNIGMKEILKSYSDGRINIIVGPEGGFEDYEIEQLVDVGARIVTLGPRILRTETAGFTAISIVLYELGDLGVV